MLGSLGCARREAPAPLTLDGLASERFEPGGRVVMRADGVEPSVEGRVRFEGTLYRPGERPASVDAQAPASAPRRGEIEWVMTPRLLRDIGGRGTFAGRIEVELAAPGGGARRAGTLPVRVDILGDDARERPLAVVRHEQEARALASKLGLTLGVADAGLAGLEVETVAPHSTAAAAGVRPGDRIVTLDGVLLDTISDFRVPEGSDRAKVAIARGRDGSATPIELGLGTFAFGAPLSPLLLAGTLAFVWLLLLWFSPLATLQLDARRFRRVVARVSRTIGLAPSDGVSGVFVGTAAPAPARVGASVRRLRATAGWVVAFAATLSGFGWLALHGRAADLAGRSLPGLAALVFAVATLDLTLSVRVGGGRAIRDWARGAAPLALTVGAAGLLCGAADLAGALGAQGGSPWEWLALRDPIGLAVFGSYLLAAFAATDRLRGARGAVALGLQLEFAAVAALGAVLFLGGPLAPPAAPAWGLALFAAKSLALLVTGVAVRPVARQAWGRVLAFALVEPALVYLWLLVGDPERTAPVVGPLLAAFCGAFVIQALLKAPLTRAGDVRVHRFL